MPKRELVFTVTAKDCDWKYTKGSGAGGQHRNKTSSAVHCTHRASGAHGFAQDHRQQRKNRALAFQRMTATRTFKMWLGMEFARETGALDRLKQKITEETSDPRITKVEVKYDDGPYHRWGDEDDAFEAGTIQEES